MFKNRTAVLFGVAFILVIVLATTAYFKMTTAAPVPSSPAANLASVSAAHSVAMSEQTLRGMLNAAYDNHWGPRGQLLLRILNGRFEHRCCGLPR